MTIRDRTDIKNFILEIEKTFPVNDWMVNDIHLWPLIRLKLYFAIINHLETPAKNLLKKTENTAKKTEDLNPTSFQKIVKIIKNISTLYYSRIKLYIQIRNLKKKETIFVGAGVHRAEINGVLYNKFFDPLIANNIETSFKYLEYGKVIKNKLSHEKTVVDFPSFVNLFRKAKQFNFNQYDLKLKNYSDLEIYLNQVFQEDSEISASLCQKVVMIRIREFYEAFMTANHLLNKIKPQKLYILFYYGYPGFAITAAANKLKIKTIEMQHGPQTDLHLAYSNWSNIPINGYDMIPRNFWCWDKQSGDTISSWAENSPLYHVEINGNPWHTFNFKYKESNEKFILYTLQPEPLTIDKLLSKPVVEVIKKSSIKWYLRFHPRQTELDKQQILDVLKAENLLDKTDITLANEHALPELLKNCIFHVTHFSGSAIEAQMMGKKSLILNPIGLSSFPDYFKKNDFIYIRYNDIAFEEKYNNFVNYSLLNN